MALKKDQPDVTSWKPGQLVIGGSNWSCAHNVLKPESKTIYTKVAEIKRPKPYVVEIHTTDAGYILRNPISATASIFLLFEKMSKIRNYLTIVASKTSSFRLFELNLQQGKWKLHA